MSYTSLPNSIIIKILGDVRRAVAEDHKKKFQASLSQIVVSDEDWDMLEYNFGRECWNLNNDLRCEPDEDFSETCISTYVFGIINGLY